MTRVFIAYSTQDESYREELEKQLSGLRRNGYIDTWSDCKITKGEPPDATSSESLLNARVILLLVSADSLASDYFHSAELKAAFLRYEQGEAIVIPIILRACNWQDTALAQLQALPSDDRPIEAWENIEEAWMNVSNGIKATIRRMNGADEEIEFESSTNPVEELLASLRRRALAATEAQDFRILHFDIKQFKLEHPKSQEIDEIERMVRNGLAYETQTTRTTVRRKQNSATNKRPRTILFVLIVLIILAAACYWYFARRSQ
jgi:hypothetical protein